MSATIRRLLRTVLLGACLVALPARAVDYTDIWWIPEESGWGLNVVQADNVLFLTFFIYGADTKPTWYTAILNWDGVAYSGGLFATQGTYYALPWNPALRGVAQVGTATFQPDNLNAYQATLTYTVNNVGTVIKAIQRQTLAPIALAGSYVGGQVGGYSNCAAAGSYTDTYDLGVTQTGGVATFTFNYADAQSVCTLSGPLEQHGQLYRIAGASYQCTGGALADLNTTATVYEIKQTAQGIEGRLAATLNSGCQENANFSATLKQ
ncbi:MAG TPA: hypothetical protein VGI14_10045 [Casimicrobiaceae bacterium]|jgi:hypothetical protein